MATYEIPEISIIRCEDWEGIYFDGKLRHEKHSLDATDILSLLKIPYTYQYMEDLTSEKGFERWYWDGRMDGLSPNWSDFAGKVAEYNRLQSIKKLEELKKTTAAEFPEVIESIEKALDKLREEE